MLTQWQSKEHKINYLKRNNRLLEKEIITLLRQIKDNNEEIERLKK